jgi:alpha-tubulin suppressor-like RCC1 family protein
VSSPTAVASIANARLLSALANHTCAGTDSGLFCWGSGTFGEISGASTDGGTWADSSTPVAVTAVPGDVADVQAGGVEVDLTKTSAHTCALSKSGELSCWGANCGWQLGVGNGDSDTCPSGSTTNCSEAAQADTNSATPLPLPLPFEAIQVAAGGAHTCALSRAGRVYCWGFNQFGQLGNADAKLCSRDAREVTGVEDVVQIAAGGGHTCAVHSNGTVTCWGRLWKDLAPNGSLNSPPTAIPGISDAIDVTAAHGSHTCVRTRSHELRCWGENENAEIGLIEGTSTDGKILPLTVPDPRLVPEASPALNADAGGNHTCAWREGLELWCWGQHGWGAIGVPLLQAPTMPVRVFPSL